MFSFVNQIDAGLFKRALVLGLFGVFLCGTLIPTTVAAKDHRNPSIIPGDGDGPAGAQDAVLIQDRMNSNILPLCLKLWYPSIGLVAMRVASSRTVIWVEPTSTEPRASGDLRR